MLLHITIIKFIAVIFLSHLNRVCIDTMLCIHKISIFKPVYSNIVTKCICSTYTRQAHTANRVNKCDIQLVETRFSERQIEIHFIYDLNVHLYVYKFHFRI